MRIYVLTVLLAICALNGRCLSQNCTPEWTLEYAAGELLNVVDLVVYDPDAAGPLKASLVAGGSFGNEPGVPNYIAMWNNDTWEEMDGGFDDPVFGLAVVDLDGAGPQPPLLFAGGRFSQAGGLPAGAIACWDGTRWSALGTGVSGGDVHALAAFDPDGPGPGSPVLVAGGSFTHAGGIPVNRIAAWDGLTWSPLGDGFDDSVLSLIVHDDGFGPRPATL